MDIAVKTKNLKKIYLSGENAVHALRGVNLEIARGESVAIIGSSGSTAGHPTKSESTSSSKRSA